MIGATSFWFHSFFRRRPDERSAQSSSSARPGTTASRQDVIVAAITSNVRRRLFGDYIVADWAGAGLLFPSIVTGLLRTIKQTMIEWRLGQIADGEMEQIGRLLRPALAL